ncbi:MAG: hypothetical protein LBN42_04065, partial [Oscillospiraceae bacterium]|nr:hypothetical protein [Oscillospiraceae bacterium]
DDDDDDDGALLFDEDGNLVPVMNTNAALGPAEKKKEKKSTAPKYPSLSGGMGYKAPEPPPKKGLKGVVSSVKKKPE